MCNYNARWDDLDGPDPGPCQSEATHDRECTQNAAPVCAAHKCRCSKTFAERARIEESRRIPSDWMAL